MLLLAGIPLHEDPGAKAPLQLRMKSIAITPSLSRAVFLRAAAYLRPHRLHNLTDREGQPRIPDGLKNGHLDDDVVMKYHPRGPLRQAGEVVMQQWLQVRFLVWAFAGLRMPWEGKGVEDPSTNVTVSRA